MLLITAGQFDRTIFTAVFRRTIAIVAGSSVYASSVYARHIAFAFVYVDFAMFTFETVLTFARITADYIDAFSVPTRITFAFVDVYFAIHAGQTDAT